MCLFISAVKRKRTHLWIKNRIRNNYPLETAQRVLYKIPMVNTHKELIEAFGGADEFARQVNAAGGNTSGNAARVQKQRNSIPNDLWLAVVEAAQTPENIRAYPGIAGLTLEKMFELKRGREAIARFPEERETSIA